MSIAFIVFLTVANLLPAAECTASRGNGGGFGTEEENDFNERSSKAGGNFLNSLQGL